MVDENGTKPRPDKVDALVVGTGPAGLMAAETLARAGRDVVLTDAKPSAGRKLLMAGKSGLNLTKDEDPSIFLSHYGNAAEWLAPMLKEFGPKKVARFARDLGQPVFTGSSGRVFPEAMKASPLLRAWLGRINAELRLRWRLRDITPGRIHFDTPDGERILEPSTCVLALGGASWSRLGSDGAWAPLLARSGIQIAPFQPANMGLSVSWSAYMQPHFGKPLKNITLRAGPKVARGEAVISERGLEGGGIYLVSAALREGAALRIDLLPDLPETKVTDRIARHGTKKSKSNLLRALGLDAAKRAILQEFAHPLPKEPADLSKLLKALPVGHGGPRPLDEAISTAGGIKSDDLTDGLMLKSLPGVFVAGEMLDWEAPTGGYLITACLATGLWAGRHAAEWKSIVAT